MPAEIFSQEVPDCTWLKWGQDTDPGMSTAGCRHGGETRRGGKESPSVRCSTPLIWSNLATTSPYPSKFLSGMCFPTGLSHILFIKLSNRLEGGGRAGITKGTVKRQNKYCSGSCNKTHCGAGSGNKHFSCSRKEVLTWWMSCYL